MYKNTVYQSSLSKNMEKSQIDFCLDSEAEDRVLNIYPQLKYQKVLGFGSAFTDSSALNFAAMSDKNKDEFIRLYFDKEQGLGLNFCRTHINSCDFSGGQYCYVEQGDKDLTTFSIKHDEENIIPLIKRAKEKCNGELVLFCSPWSPPAFMKTNGSMLKGGKLKPEFYESYANYFVKYIKSYKEHGINFWALTVQNEPMATQTWESCKYTAIETAEFVKEYLYPALKAAKLDTKIFIWDHNKEHIVDWADDIHKVDGAAERIEGLAFHWYSGDHFDALRMAHELNPEKWIIETEFCVVFDKDPQKDWESALKYAHDMIGNFNNYTSAITDWNMLLDENGGPFHDRRVGCEAMLHYNPETDELRTTRLYNAMAHFSKYINRNAVRIGVSSFDRNIYLTAFENPDNTITAVILNYGKAKQCTVRINNYAAKIDLDDQSITTVILDI